MIEEREKKITWFLLQSGHTRVKDIANYMKISEKTVSNSLKRIDSYLQEFNITLVRKPKVGVYLDGSNNQMYQLLTSLNTRRNSVPETKEERVIFIFSSLLRKNDYLTIDQFSQDLYISRGTIEKDLQEVEGLLAKEGVELYKKPGKGIKLQISERERRVLTSKFISNFWGGNWFLKQEGDQVLQEFSSIQPDMKGLFPKEGLNEIISLVREFSDRLHFRFTDYAFQSLVIHLAIAIERIRKGEYLELEESTSLEGINRSRINSTDTLTSMLEERFSINIPEFEKNYINIHLTAAQDQANVVQNIKRSDYTGQKNNLVNFVEQSLEKSMYDKELIEGLTTHMHSVINRLQLGLSIKNPYVNEIKQSFSLSFEKALYFKGEFEKKFGILIDDDETAYIALHFGAYFERTKAFHNQLRVVLVCSTGLGTVRLLSARIKKYFPMLKIEKILSAQALLEEEIQADFVISTINLQLEHTPTIVVSPMMNQDEMKFIDNTIHNLMHQKDQATNPFLDLVDKRNIITQLQAETMKEVITIVGNHLIKYGYALEGLVESAMKREALSFTSFDTIATPHADPKFVKQSAILIATLKNPVQWGSSRVNKVFFIVLEEVDSLDLDNIYEKFYDYLDSKKNMDKLTQAKTADEVIQSLKEGEVT